MCVLAAHSETCQLVEEDENGKLSFVTPFHYQSQVIGATATTHNPARSRRLAQEISTLASSLPLSPSSSVFVRCDEERLDVMKVREVLAGVPPTAVQERNVLSLSPSLTAFIANLNFPQVHLNSFLIVNIVHHNLFSRYKI